MERIVIIGEGYPAGKAFRIAQRTHPKADLIWISDYSDQKYSPPMLSLLLRSGAPPAEWSRTRARIKVGFERYQQDINLYPQRVKKINIDPAESEISFMTGMGKTSYSFDKVLIFPARVAKTPDVLEDNQHVWPDDSCVQFLVNNWEGIENPVVVGSDMSLVQALIQGGKKFIWIRSGNTFSDQVQYFLDQKLKQLGVEIEPRDSEADAGQVLKNMSGTDQHHGPVFFCHGLKTDYARLEGYGLKDLDIERDNSDILHQKSVALIDGSGPQGIHALNLNPETELVRSLEMVEAVFAGSEYKPSSQKVFFWNMGMLSAAMTGLDIAQARQMGFTPEFAVIHGSHGISADRPYVLNMVMDKPTKKILGVEAIGEKAHEWVNLAACLIKNNLLVTDIAEPDIIWPDPTINPFSRCARMLENKARPGILPITPDELKQSADEGAVFYLLDVRKKEEFAQGRLPGAENIPMHQLKKRAMEIPRFTPIVLYSECSGRAYEAARLLKNMGAKQLYVLDGGYGLYTLEKELSPLSRNQPAVPGACPTC